MLFCNNAIIIYALIRRDRVIIYALIRRDRVNKHVMHLFLELHQLNLYLIPGVCADGIVVWVIELIRDQTVHSDYYAHYAIELSFMETLKNRIPLLTS